ncbi:Transporter, YjgP/YjgQ family [Candidatus Sulfotelmatobacter kueseliae]|uniref:Transporter, YjgP/YjgQ family n=1 Tax=Candidatus Sulfotelmatobacter kueseliae TaxID=2042962 RepID=A0A2U3L9X9_9BACT|nr:Transporter, YjgP/YjgQ family [Candidatus Sulfotelmatobacter kueseliae]
MRILTRYILREVTAHALIGAAIFTFVLFTRDLGRILELVVRASAPLPSVAEIFFFTVPLALTYTLPMSVLVGILIGLSRLAADSEITAMRASGLGVWSFLRVLSIFVLAAWLLALGNGVYVAPRSQAALARLEDRLKGSQVSFEVQPRVFYEGFPKIVLYVQDVQSAQGAALWKGVFMADLSDAANPKITLAKEGIVVSEGPDRLHLHLIDGSAHETDPKQADRYQISTFLKTEIPIELPSTENKGDESQPAAVMDTWALREKASHATPVSARWYLIEFHRRFALSSACLVLALVGIPLGLSSKKSGKSGGFVLTILLVFAYYVVSLIGVSLAKQGTVGPWFGTWLADLVFLALGLFLLWQAERRPFELASFRPFWKRDAALPQAAPTRNRRENAFERAATRRRVFSASFPTLLDDYVLRDFFIYLGMILATFLVLVLVFTLFELLGDILRNQVPALVVAEYLLNVTPYLLYNVAPLVMLLAVLVTFGLMNRSNEITAIKATGISIYRIVTPVIVAAAVLATALFFADQFYLPRANKRQEALHNQIKGKPPQTYLRPDRKWIFGQNNDIYYYQFLDPDRDQFGNVTVFQLDRASFTITRRIHAERAHWADNLNRWIYEQGWDRSFNGSAIGNYRPFDVATFPELPEAPSYFKKEVKQYTEMNYEELRRYIRDLQQSGFDVVRLRVQLHQKLSYPLITLIMAVLAVPFALTAEKKGAVTGVAVAVLIAVFYTVVSRLFEAMGNLSQLPPGLAAWSPDLIFVLLGGYLILKVPT